MNPNYHHYSLLLALIYSLLPTVLAQGQVAPSVVASQLGFTTSTVPPFPSSTASSSQTEELLVSQWSLGKGRIQDGPDNLAFVNDPFPNNPAPGAGPSNTAGPVLQVTYAAGSFSHDTGGAQFYTLWNTTGNNTDFQRMMVTYEVAFEADFDWVKGGKLPGLRGGLDSTGCSGGNLADGKECFSSRLMWRKNGAGEVYAYIPTPNNLCSEKSITCNSDFGVSIERSSFGFQSARWSRITMVVLLNNPPDVANGNIMLYFNDILAVNQTGLQIRSSDTVHTNGFYFSTFFGGSDDSWATPKTTHTFYRNIQLWGSSNPSQMIGQKVVNQASTASRYTTLSMMVLAAVLGTVFCI